MTASPTELGNVSEAIASIGMREDSLYGTANRRRTKQNKVRRRMAKSVQ